MFRASRLSVPRKELVWNFLPKKCSDITDASRLSNFTSRIGISTARQDFMKNGNIYGRVIADFSIFKGKAALFVSPSLPKFTKIDAGISRLDKKGAVFLKFLPAIGQRKYDSEKKQIFALSPTEVGCLISLGSSESCEFLHDPAMKSSDEGKVKKKLSVQPLSDASGYFINLNVTNNLLKTNEHFSVPVTKAEFAVMRSAFSFVLPHLMGWGQLIAPQLESTSSKQLEAHVDPDFEWGR